MVVAVVEVASVDRAAVRMDLVLVRVVRSGLVSPNSSTSAASGWAYASCAGASAVLAADAQA
jgi:hypothetical protein